MCSSLLISLQKELPPTEGIELAQLDKTRTITISNYDTSYALFTAYEEVLASLLAIINTEKLNRKIQKLPFLGKFCSQHFGLEPFLSREITNILCWVEVVLQNNEIIFFNPNQNPNYEFDTRYVEQIYSKCQALHYDRRQGIIVTHQSHPNLIALNQLRIQARNLDNKFNFWSRNIIFKPALFRSITYQRKFYRYLANYIWCAIQQEDEAIKARDQTRTCHQRRQRTAHPCPPDESSRD